MRRRQEPRRPRPPLPPHLEQFNPTDWGCSDPWPSPTYHEALERRRVALREWCDRYGTSPLELIRERAAVRRAALFPNGIPNPTRRSTP